MLLRDKIYYAIRRAILSCDLQPGQDIREVDLADRYRVSRSPIRDALLRLEQEQLVIVLPRQGYRIKPVTMDDINNIHSLRLIIEPACAAEAAARDDPDLEILQTFKGRVQDPREPETLVEHNGHLHNAIATLARNARMTVIARDLVEQFGRLTRVAVNRLSSAQVLDLGREHDAIIRAILSHDAAQAARLATAHLDSSRERLVGALNPDQP